MRCPACKSEGEPGRRFCADCGAPQSARCPKCNADSPPGKLFCADCGTSIAGAPAAGNAAAANARPRPATDRSLRVAEESSDLLTGERKVVTVLFADIKGSMELIEDLDPEEARAVVEPALKLMVDSARHYGGYVVQTTGDGIFALFGAPVAHEDHPQRALYAALRIQEELRRYSDRIRAEGGLPMQGRVGVNTGEVVLRSLSIGDGQTEYTPIGHSTSLAARLQTLAPVGSIATTETLRQVCEGYFMFKDLGPTRVKGVTDLVNVFEVTGLGPLRTRLQRSAGRGLSRFVGRDREMTALKSAAEQARNGRGQIVAAMADAGTGKSRLFFEFTVVSRVGWMVLETFSVSHGKASAYLPLIDMLHGYFGIEANDNSRKRREKVAGRLSILDRALEDAQPYLFGLLGIVDGDDPLLQMDERLRTRRTLEAIKRILLRESLNQPLMVIFEDLHWIDEQTQDFLNLLADSIGTAKLVLLVNYRPGYSHPWNGKTYYTQVRLDPLGSESAWEMLTALLGGGEHLAALKRLIIEKTEGTPFFMEEMVQVLFDDATLVRDGEVKLKRPLAELKIPTSVQAILAARIDRLPADAKELLQTLAVIGREFPLSLIAAMTATTNDELDRLLNDLQLAEFIYEQPAVGDTQYIFKHALTQDVAYNTVLIELRKSLHERIGAALEALYPNSIDDHVAALAHHYGRSGNVDAGMQYLTHAGRQKLLEARRAAARLAGDSPSGMPEHRATTAAGASPVDPARPSQSDGMPVATGELAVRRDCVDAIWRYPVKSMAGQQIRAVAVTERGLLGDRLYALVDKASNRTAVVRKWAEALLSYYPQFVTEPEPGAAAPALRIAMPGGLTLTSDEPDAEARLSAAFDRKLTLMATAPAGLLIEVPAGTFGGALSDTTELPLSGAAPAGAFFDYACVHLIATSTLDHLQQSYPQGLFDVRRFRPNIVVRSQGAPFIENSWVGRTLAIGDEVVLRVIIPCPRCISVTLAQDDLPRDPRILRTVAEHNMCDLGDFGTLPCAGVYAEVVKPGTIRSGDTVRCLD